MRDPDLVTRAQRAAVALERAWERWRAMHGLSADPMPPVSSYVGYSIEEPWGRPRVVFGVDAREAELLAALLDHHECVGPFYQEAPRGAAYGAGAPGNGGSPLDEAWPRIPAQAQAAEERPPQWDQDDQPGQADGGTAGPGGRVARLVPPMVISSTTLTVGSRRSRARRTAWRICHVMTNRVAATAAAATSAVGGAPNWAGPAGGSGAQRAASGRPPRRGR